MAKTRAISSTTSKRKAVDNESQFRCTQSNEDKEDTDDELKDDYSLPPPTKSVRRMRKKLNVETTPINYDLSFEDLGGVQEQIRIIHESIIYRQENSLALKKAGLKYTVGGILLEGPPGTGKTICAHTIAAELSRRTRKKYTFFTHNAVESFSKWMGDSEKTIRKLFRAAADSKPAIIFFDEFDSMCPRRDSDRSGGHSYRTIVGTLLAEFNNIQDNDTIVIATTNLKENIDPALLRNGRFDFFIHFPLPNENQRLDILRIKMRDFFVQPEVLEFIAKQTDGFAGSSLTFLCDEAKLNAFKRQKSSNELKRRPLKSVDREDFLQVFRTVQLPKIVTSHSDKLLDVICQQIAHILEPYIFHENDFTRDGTLDSNCFLIWSHDSTVLLNEKIIPKILQLLSQPSYTITQDAIDNYQAQNVVSAYKAFNSIIHQAKKNERPCIIFVENIDALEMNAEEIYRSLGYLNNHSIFVLATASRETDSLPPSLQLLFKPFGTEKAYQLPRPSEKEISDCFEYIFKKYLQPVLAKVSSKPKKLSSSKSLVAEISRMNVANSYEQVNALRSEIRNLCRVSQPSVVIENLMTILERQ